MKAVIMRSLRLIPDYRLAEYLDWLKSSGAVPPAEVRRLRETGACKFHVAQGGDDGEVATSYVIRDAAAPITRPVLTLAGKNGAAGP